MSKLYRLHRLIPVAGHDIERRIVVNCGRTIAAEDDDEFSKPGDSVVFCVQCAGRGTHRRPAQSGIKGHPMWLQKRVPVMGQALR